VPTRIATREVLAREFVLVEVTTDDGLAGLGGFRDAVPAYASGGYYRAGDPLENIEREFARYLAMGFSDFKIKVGGAPLDVDVERVRVAREMIGPRARLALDANNAWRTPAEALRFARAVERFRIG
jgi:D-arabinonate dehydratase